jgi:RHS repeat-associated protein
LRLLTARTTGSTAYPQWGLSESYDQYGNRTCQTVTGGGGPSFCQAFTVKNQPSGYTYDADGNLTVEPLAPSNNYTYDANNRLVSLSGGGNGSYVYDGSGIRVQQSANGTTTVDIYSGSKMIAQYQNGAAANSPTREFIYADSDNGSRLLAVVSGGNINYMHQDHLSVRLITNSSGNDIGEQGHYPFGESWYQVNTTTQWRFTTYQRDQESGLDYALARFYNSRVAGFCSADPLEGNPDDPLSWNRYSYAENDPINLIDPSGKGFLTWLFDAVAILADIFSGGATIPETIQLGIDLQGISDLSLFAAVVQTGKATEQQGQQQSIPPPMGGPSDTQMRLNCIQNALNSLAPGVSFHPKRGPNGEDSSDPHSWGGHENGTFESDPVSQQAASQIEKSVEKADQGKILPRLLPGVDHGARYPTNPSVGGSLHIPTGTAPASDSPGGLQTVTITGHIDTYNPRTGDLAGIFGHIGHDVVWGTVKQKVFHGDLDKRCPH